MVARHLIFAGLVATAPFAQAGLVDAPAQSASGIGSWTAHTRMGDTWGVTTMVYVPGAGGVSPSPVLMGGVSGSPAVVFEAPVQLFVPVAAPAPMAAPAAPMPVVLASAPQAAPLVPASMPATQGNLSPDAAAPPAVTDIPKELVSMPAQLALLDEVVPVPTAPRAPNVVPEPGSALLILAGLFGVAAQSRRRRK